MCAPRMMLLVAAASCQTAGAPSTSRDPARVDAAPAQPATTTLTDVCPRKLDGGPPSLREVDWSNCGYFGEHGQFRDGHAEVHRYSSLGGAHDSIDTSLVAVAYGEVDADAGEEAVVLLKQTTWIASPERRTPTVVGKLVVFALREGRVRVIAEGGTGAPASVRVSKGRVMIKTSWSWEQVVQQRCDVEMELKDGKLVETATRCSDGGAP